MKGPIPMVERYFRPEIETDGLRGMPGLSARATLAAPKSIVRSEGKAVRVIDKRKI